MFIVLVREMLGDMMWGGSLGIVWGWGELKDRAYRGEVRMHTNKEVRRKRVQYVNNGQVGLPLRCVKKLGLV